MLLLEILKWSFRGAGWRPCNQSRKSAGSPTGRNGLSQRIKKISWYPNQLESRKSALPKEKNNERTLSSFRKEKRSWYITSIAKWKMARNLSSPKRSKNFCWLECWRFMSTELSLRLSDRGCLELNFLVESKKDSIGDWIFAITCQQAKCLD